MGESVRTLLEMKADTSIGEKDGYTPCHGAAFHGRAEIMKMLIDHGMNPSKMLSDGYTPLHFACWGSEDQHTKTAKVLLDNGVLPTEPTSDGLQPIDQVRNN